MYACEREGGVCVRMREGVYVSVRERGVCVCEREGCMCACV